MIYIPVLHKTVFKMQTDKHRQRYGWESSRESFMWSLIILGKTRQSPLLTLLTHVWNIKQAYLTNTFLLWRKFWILNINSAQSTITWEGLDKGLSRLAWPAGTSVYWNNLSCVKWCEKTQPQSRRQHSLDLGPKLRERKLAEQLACMNWFPPALDWICD